MQEDNSVSSGFFTSTQQCSFLSGWTEVYGAANEAETQSEREGRGAGLRLFKYAWFTSLALSHFPSYGPIGAQPFYLNFFSLNPPVHNGSLAAVGYFHASTYVPSLTESQEKSCGAFKG